MVEAKISCQIGELEKEVTRLKESIAWHETKATSIFGEAERTLEVLGNKHEHDRLFEELCNRYCAAGYIMSKTGYEDAYLKIGICQWVKDINIMHPPIEHSSIAIWLTGTGEIVLDGTRNGSSGLVQISVYRPGKWEEYLLGELHDATVIAFLQRELAKLKTTAANYTAIDDERFFTQLGGIERPDHHESEPSR